MPVVTLQSLKMIGRLEVGKLRAWSSDFVGTQCIHASDGTTFQVAYFGQKVIFSVSDVSERFKESVSRFPANFNKISESRIFDLSRDPTSHRAKISLFQNMLGFIQYGSRLFGIDASSDSAKFQDDWLSESGLNVKFQNQKLAKNGEFDK